MMKIIVGEEDEVDRFAGDCDWAFFNKIKFHSKEEFVRLFSDYEELSVK